MKRQCLRKKQLQEIFVSGVVVVIFVRFLKIDQDVVRIKYLRHLRTIRHFSKSFGSLCGTEEMTNSLPDGNHYCVLYDLQLFRSIISRGRGPYGKLWTDLFFHPLMAQARSARAMKTRKEKHEDP